jgi:hypothetical protein
MSFVFAAIWPCCGLVKEICGERVIRTFVE